MRSKARKRRTYEAVVGVERWKEGRKGEGERERQGRPTSNHNLVLCRVVCRGSEEAVGNEFVRFAGLSCLRVSAVRIKRARAYFHG